MSTAAPGMIRFTGAGLTLSPRSGTVRGSGPGVTTFGPPGTVITRSGGFSPVPGGGSGFSPIPGGGTSTVFGGPGGGPILGDPCSRLPDFLQGGCREIQRRLENKVFGGNGGGECEAGFVRVGDMCVPATTGGQPGGPEIPGSPNVITPAERSMGATGLVAPSLVATPQHRCPRFGDGKTGIVHVHPLTGQLVCLPRGVNGSKFGFVRKNKPRPKPPMTAAEAKSLRKVKTLERKAKKLASQAGFTCKAKASRG